MNWQIIIRNIHQQLVNLRDNYSIHRIKHFITQQRDMSGEQLPALKRRAYKDQVFAWIESGETEKVKHFLESYEQHGRSFMATNSWTLAMFACRYGNLELLQFLQQKKFTLENNYQYTLVHAACFGNELEVLKYLIDTLKRDASPLIAQQSPLKICFRAENQVLAEFLISRGAYYQYGQFCHNVRMEIEQMNPQQPKYKTIQRGHKNELLEIEVPDSLVLSHNTISRESPMLSFLRFARVRNFFYTKRIAESTNPLPIVDEKKKENFIFLTKIAFENNDSTAKILEFLVGKKESNNHIKNMSQQNQFTSNILPNSQEYPQQ